MNPTATFNKWYIEDGNLVLEEDDYYCLFKYQVVDEILSFLAPIDNDDSVMKAEECIAYLKGDAGKTNSAYKFIELKMQNQTVNSPVGVSLNKISHRFRIPEIVLSSESWKFFSIDFVIQLCE